MDTQMKKGVIEMCILFLISSEKRYGYQIMKSVNEVFPDVNESTIYAVLKRLHKEGAAEINIGETSGGPPRKYYSITEKGKETLVGAIENWEHLIVAVKTIGIK